MTGRQRIPPIDRDSLDADQQRVYDAIAGTRGRVAGPFAVLLHNAELADRVQRLGAYLRYEAGLDRRLAELAVLVTSAAWSCEFEWAAHEPIARAAGVPDEVIEAVRSSRRPVTDDGALLDVRDFAHQLVTTGDVGKETYARVLDRLGPGGTVELAVVVGYYSMLAMTINAHRVALPG